MNTTDRRGALAQLGLPVLAGAAALLGTPPASAVPATVTALVKGSVTGPPEAVLFSGVASITGNVILDNVFGAPPVLEIVIDFSRVSAIGLSTRTGYTVAPYMRLHRPLAAFDTIEVNLPYYVESQPAKARAALAMVGVGYNAATGIRVSPMVITAGRPA